MLRPPTAMERALDDADTSSSAIHLPPLRSGWLRINQVSELDAGTGGKLWPAAGVTCRWLSRHADDLSGASLLELGCGTGAVGIFAAASGARRVLLTDGSDSALSNAKMNANLNRIALGAADVATRKFAFGDAALPSGRFDYIIASDCVYGSDWRPLATSLRALMMRQADSPPRVIMAVPHRSPGPLLSGTFLASAKGLRLSTLELERATPEQPVAVALLEVALDR